MAECFVNTEIRKAFLKDINSKEYLERFHYVYIKIFLHGQKYSAQYKNIKNKSQAGKIIITHPMVKGIVYLMYN